MAALLRIRRRPPAAPSPLRQPPDLPEPGTRVVLLFRGEPRHGAVMPYDRRWSPCQFPVRFDDGQWRLLGADELTLEAATGGGGGQR
jgi:hypothetical protein